MAVANYSKAFVALFHGARVSDCDNIVMTLADHPEICHHHLDKQGRYLLQYFCEDVLADRVKELTGISMDFDDEPSPAGWDRIVRAYCAAIKFEANDEQVRSLVEFFDTFITE